MKIVVTGSAGRIGRAICAELRSRHHHVVGIDIIPSATTTLQSDITDSSFLSRALEGVDAVIHAAALHVPHLRTLSDAEFHRVNVGGTRLIAEIARRGGAKRFVFTSTTALYGHAVQPGRCTWIDEEVRPIPKTIYHRTKLEAETLLEGEASPQFAIRIMRMSRCFPEPANLMALYRLHRGIDARDVATAHAAALRNDGDSCERYVISGASPFTRDDCTALADDAPAVFRERCPALWQLFEERGWTFPQSIDRIYSPAAAHAALGWQARHGFFEVVAQLDRESAEVLAAQPA